MGALPTKLRYLQEPLQVPKALLQKINFHVNFAVVFRRCVCVCVCACVCVYVYVYVYVYANGHQTKEWFENGQRCSGKRAACSMYTALMPTYTTDMT